jgi:hypothetical protein
MSLASKPGIRIRSLPPFEVRGDFGRVGMFAGSNPASINSLADTRIILRIFLVGLASNGFSLDLPIGPFELDRPVDLGRFIGFIGAEGSTREDHRDSRDDLLSLGFGEKDLLSRDFGFDVPSADGLSDGSSLDLQRGPVDLDRAVDLDRLLVGKAEGTSREDDRDSRDGFLSLGFDSSPAGTSSSSPVGFLNPSQRPKDLDRFVGGVEGLLRKEDRDSRGFGVGVSTTGGLSSSTGILCPRDLDRRVSLGRCC